MRRFFKLIARLVFCMFVASATLVIGVAFHQSFSWTRFTAETLPRSWPEATAFVTGFVGALQSGDPGSIAAALADWRALVIALVLALAVAAVIWHLRGPGESD
jgi:uncharacterized membrane protein